MLLSSWGKLGLIKVMAFFPLGIALLLQSSELLKDSGDWTRTEHIDNR